MKKNIKKIVLLLITFIFLYFVFINLNIKELFEVIKSFNLKFIILLIFSALCSQTCRGLCFKQLISNEIKAPLKEIVQLCITGSALNIVLPARAGDLFRAYYIGQKYKTNKVKIFGSVMLERLLDIFVIFCFLIIGVLIYKKTKLAIDLCIIAGSLIIAGIIFCIIAYKYNKSDNICRYIINKTQNLSGANLIKNTINFINKQCNSFINGFEIIEKPKKAFLALVFSFGIWFFESLNVYYVICGFGYHLHWSVTLFVICFIAFACMIPSTSIFIGPNQLAVIMAFSLYNINKETALAISLVNQVTITILTVLIAVIFLFKNNISFKTMKNNLDLEKNDQ